MSREKLPHTHLYAIFALHLKMKKLAQLLRNTYELILAFLLLIIAYSENEQEHN